MRSNSNPLLVVEDNDDHFVLLQYALKKAAVTYPVHWSKTGEDAIAYLSNSTELLLPKLVLLDLNLPGCSGFDVLKWIRQHPSLKSQSVVVLTSSSLDSDITKAQELGANAFLTKPCELEKLVEMVKMIRLHWLEGEQVTDLHDKLVQQETEWLRPFAGRTINTRNPAQ